MTGAKPAQVTTPPTAAGLLAEAVEGLSRDAFRASQQADALAPTLDALRRELCVVLGLQSYDSKLPGDLIALLDELDGLASDVGDAAEDLWRALSRFGEVAP